ncbi:MAG: pyridoxal phosphate-dependent aminotransferase [Paraclostridium sp.]
MNQLGHGANVEDMCRRYNKNSKDIIDFSSNINPYLVENLDKYLLEGLKECSKYPDIEYTSLRGNIANYLCIDSSYIIPGNGATEIIYLLMKSIKGRLAILNPTFSEYERSANISGLDVVNLYLDKENNFEIDIEHIKSNIDKFDSLFICNPSNPIGKVYQLNELVELMKKYNKLLIIDETFMEFVEEESKYTLTNYIQDNPNIFIIKAITKFFGMPGIRLGYGVTSNKGIISKMYEIKEPWTINTFADTISNYIFKESEYIKKSKLYFVNERVFMTKELENIKNIKVYKTDTNFILIKLLDKEAKEFREDIFINGGILIRDASNFRNLDNSYIRIAIKSHEENLKIIDEFRKVFGV